MDVTVDDVIRILEAAYLCEDGAAEEIAEKCGMDVEVVEKTLDRLSGLGCVVLHGDGWFLTTRGDIIARRTCEGAARESVRQFKMFQESVGVRCGIPGWVVADDEADEKPLCSQCYECCLFEPTTGGGRVCTYVGDEIEVEIKDDRCSDWRVLNEFVREEFEKKRGSALVALERMLSREVLLK